MDNIYLNLLSGLTDAVLIFASSFATGLLLAVPPCVLRLEEIFMLEGYFYDGDRTYRAGQYCQRAIGERHCAGSESGAVVLLIFRAAFPPGLTPNPSGPAARGPAPERDHNTPET